MKHTQSRDWPWYGSPREAREPAPARMPAPEPQGCDALAHIADVAHGIRVAAARRHAIGAPGQSRSAGAYRIVVSSLPTG